MDFQQFQKLVEQMRHEQQFQKLVEQMRHEQKEYFRTRSAQSLEESKRLEKAVDKALRELADKQERMF